MASQLAHTFEQDKNTVFVWERRVVGPDDQPPSAAPPPPPNLPPPPQTF